MSAPPDFAYAGRDQRKGHRPGSEDFDGAGQLRGTTQPHVCGQQRNVQRHGERHVERVVEGHVVAQCPRKRGERPNVGMTMIDQDLRSPQSQARLIRVRRAEASGDFPLSAKISAEASTTHSVTDGRLRDQPGSIRGSLQKSPGGPARPRAGPPSLRPSGPPQIRPPNPACTTGWNGLGHERACESPHRRLRGFRGSQLQL